MPPPPAKCVWGYYLCYLRFGKWLRLLIPTRHASAQGSTVQINVQAHLQSLFFRYLKKKELLTL